MADDRYMQLLNDASELQVLCMRTGNDMARYREVLPQFSQFFDNINAVMYDIHHDLADLERVNELSVEMLDELRSYVTIIPELDIVYVESVSANCEQIGNQFNQFVGGIVALVR